VKAATRSRGQEVKVPLVKVPLVKVPLVKVPLVKSGAGHQVVSPAARSAKSRRDPKAGFLLEAIQ
ncbi:hypothetical protein, partial [Prosthecobacter sp.]|uniref:hypothetical protein n=1 Tax=Prosthecobacter sp. TaxID=1965333 RepID=UPI002488C0EE